MVFESLMFSKSIVEENFGLTMTAMAAKISLSSTKARFGKLYFNIKWQSRTR